jgi:heme oxygenase
MAPGGRLIVSQLSSSAGSGESLRDRLRRETAEAHQRVDDLFGSCDFSTEAGYGFFLSAQSRAWETLRPLLDQGSLARADALRDDLDRLDLPTPSSLGIAIPWEASLGHRYVLEGSRLGSTVLMRELLEKAPAMAERAGAYLRESGKIAGWKQLSTALQDNRDDHDNDPTIIDDALFVFGLFERAWRATDSAQAKAG